VKKAKDSIVQPDLVEQAGRKGILWDVLTAVFVIGVVAVTFYLIQFSTDALVGNDGYFHIKYSYLMSHGHGLMKSLPWLQYTIHRDHYRDHHFLQHILYIPFTFGDLRVGAKAAAWFYATLAMAAFYFVCARRGKVAALILTFVLMGASTRFLTRMMMPRVPSMFMLMLLVVTHVIITRKHRWLAGLMFIFVWLYDGFALAIVIMFAFFLSELMVERRCNWRMLAWGIGGIAAGLVINPYFPGNVGSYLFNLQRTAGSAQLIENTGWEWRPFSSWELLNTAKSIWIALGLAVLLAMLRGKPTRESVALFLFSFFVSVLAMKARRYMEILPPFALLFLAYAWGDFWQDEQKRVGGRVPKRQWAATAALATLVAFTPFVCHEQWQDAKNERPFKTYKGAAEYVRANSIPGSIIFNTDWDDFPFLFFFNSDNHYILGLDQLYMMRYDEDLFKLWKDIVEGGIADPSSIIKERFNADYAIVVARSRNRRAFIMRAAYDPGMREVYRDKYCIVYRIDAP